MYNRKILPNGVRVVTEPMQGVRSAAVGVWVKNGSRHEPEELSGISHFIEHMVFKGTEKRSAQHIAIAMDAIGGQVNAFTTKECTCFYLKTLDTHLKTGVEILSDMLMHSKFAEQDIDLERSVVLEEIDMYEDSPEDVATDKIFEECYAGSPLGRPILGHEDTLCQMTGDTLRDYITNAYHPEDVVVALAGSFTDDDVEYICSMFGEMHGTGRNVLTPAHYQPCIVTRQKEIEQNHIWEKTAVMSMHSWVRFWAAAWHPVCSRPFVNRTVCAIRFIRSIPHMRTPVFSRSIPHWARRPRKRPFV